MQSIGPRVVAGARSFRTHLGGGGPHIPVLVSRPKSFRAFTQLFAIATIGVSAACGSSTEPKKKDVTPATIAAQSTDTIRASGRRREYAIDRDDKNAAAADRYDCFVLPQRRERSAPQL
jgi:hypothetical protein